MNSSEQHKKHVVVISRWAPPMVGGSMLFYNLFSKFPADKYDIITDSRGMSTGIDQATWLPGQYFFADNPKASKESVAKAFETSKKNNLSKPQSIKTDYFNKVEKWPIVGEVLSLASIIKMVYLYSKAFSRVSLSQSTVLLGLSDNGPALITTYLMAKKYHLPYNLYLFDLYRGNNFLLIDRIIARLTERMLLINAHHVIVNNEGTADFFRARYGQAVDPVIIYNSVFPEKYAQRSPYEPRPPYKIIFTGNISWPQEASVMNLLRAADFLQDIPLEIWLYTNKPSDKITNEAARHSNVHITYAPYSQMPQIQNQATLLFLPLAWHTRGPDIIATATPGKLTDYLASGRPMLIHAPSHSYISKYGKQNNLGLVVDQDSPELLASKIREFLQHPKKGQVYIKNALKIFQSNHNAHTNGGRLAAILNSE